MNTGNNATIDDSARKESTSAQHPLLIRKDSDVTMNKRLIIDNEASIYKEYIEQ